MSESITIERLKAIKHLEIPVPKSGLVLLRGRNEYGKTTALDGISNLLHRKDERLGLSKGASRAGIVEGFGATLTVHASRTTKAGEVESFISFEGLDPTRAITPKEKDVVAAERGVINRFADFLGINADPQLFAELFDNGVEDLNRYTSPNARSASSIVEMAKLVKADVEDHARSLDEQRVNKEGEAAGLRQGLGDLDLTKEGNETVLAQALESAIREESELLGRQKQAAETSTRLGEVRASLDRLRAESAKDDEGEARAAVDAARAVESQASEALGSATNAITSAEAAKREALRSEDNRIRTLTEAQDAAVRAAEQALEQARKTRADALAEAARVRAEVVRTQDALIGSAQQAKASAEGEVGRAMLATRNAQARVDAIGRRRQDIAAAEVSLAQQGGSIVEAPTEEQLTAARERIESARKASELGVLIRDGRRKHLAANKAAAEADQLGKAVERLRLAAAGVWNVVTKAVAPALPPGMSIADGRLVQRDGDNTFFYLELSMGRRTRIVVTALAKSLHKLADAIEKKTGVRPVPVLVFEQEFGEALDPINLVELDDLLIEVDVVGYTARNDAGKLRAIVLSEADAKERAALGIPENLSGNGAAA